MVVNLSSFDLAQCLWTSTDHLNISTVEVEHVRTWVEAAKMAVDVEWVKLRGPRKSLRRDSLNNVSLDDVLLQFGDEALVSSFPDIALGFVSKSDGLLLWQRRMGRLELVSDLNNSFNRFFVQSLDLGVWCSVWEVNVSHNLDRLIDVIENDQSGGDHKKGLRESRNGIVERGRRFGDRLEMGDRIISNETDSSTFNEQLISCVYKGTHQ